MNGYRNLNRRKEAKNPLGPEIPPGTTASPAHSPDFWIVSLAV